MFTLALALPALAADPALSDLVYARPFTLAQPMVWTMRADRPTFTEGVLVALRVSAATATVRPTADPLLMVGEWPVMRLTQDPQAGCMTFVVPTRDLGAEPVFFGPAILPGRFAADDARSQRDQAVSTGATPWDASTLSVARTAGGAPLAAQDFREIAAAAEAQCPVPMR